MDQIWLGEAHRGLIEANQNLNMCNTSEKILSRMWNYYKIHHLKGK